jgi:uncharacterized protein
VSLSIVGTFGRPRPLIGVVHLHPLPGAPRYRGEPMRAILDAAVRDALAYVENGFDGLIVENQGDVPFARPEAIGPATVAALTAAAFEVARNVRVPIGINCMANGALQAIAIARAVDARFVRVSQWVNAYVGNSGLIEGAAPEALRLRSALRADDVHVFADVHVKHGSHAIVADRTLEQLAEDTAWYGADALVVTGTTTGEAARAADVGAVRGAGRLPTLLGSGLSVAGIDLLAASDGAIVGTSVKVDGVTTNPVDPARVRALVAAARALEGAAG